MSQRNTLILIDGSSWLYRAFHALPPLTAPDGQPTGAVFGMGNMLRKLLREYSPEHIAVVFDPRGKTFRHEKYADYKANRPPIPEDLESQFPLIRELIEGLGLPVLQVEGVEADDVIGTLATQAAGQGWQALVVTGDKDMAQLVNERVQLLDTMKDRRLGREDVIEKFGVPPERIVDYLALMGDASDNIPGVPKVGPKTAAKWLQEYGSLDALVQKAGDVGGKIGENLRASLGILPLSRELATIRCDIPLPVKPAELKPRPADTEKLRALYQRLGFHRWLADAGHEAAPAAGTQPHAPATPAGPRTAAKYHCVLDEAALGALLERLEAAPLICLDTETDALDSMQAGLVGLSFAVQAGEAWYVPVAHEYLGAPAQLPMEKVLSRLKPLLQDAGKPKLGQHIKYDLNVLARHGIEVAGVRYDTMLESYVLNSTATRHDMDSLAEKYLGYQTIKFEDVAGKGKNQISFKQVDLDKATQYAAEDADITLRLHEMLLPLLGETPSLVRLLEEIEMPLVPVLARMEQNGVRLDTALLAKISQEMAQRMAELEEQAYKAAGTPFNLNSPPQLQEILYEKLKLPVLGKTPKGQPSTSEDVLEQLAAEHVLPKLILEYRGLAKLRSTYTEKLPERVNPQTGRVHTSYHQAVAVTGRLSSSDPNLQNIPVRTAEGRRIRQAFVADPGCALLSVDYSQIELRLMAHLSGDPGLVRAFVEGRDIHQATAAEVFGLPLEQVSGEQRRAAKAINFGLIYGMSAFGLARQLDIGREEAGAYMKTFFERYPGVKRFMDDTRQLAREQGYVETLFGRRLYLPDINSRNQAVRQYAERTAINAPLQGSAADLIKKAMVELQAWLSAEHPELRMIMQVHDELVFEGPQETLRKAARAIAERMCTAARLAVPLQADYGIGPNWDAAHEGTDFVRLPG
ncbi:MAG TPA: DNA polymerase I [Nevskiales bacterium]|nr:DNA polymerase I [Nevskiales bacterium]